MPARRGFRKSLVALSGGIDSAVVGVLAAAALGPENVTGVSLPSAISSGHSRDDARELAANLGIAFQTIAIAEVVAAAESALGPVFAGRPRDVAEENIQARVRGVLMMALSNKFGSLLLTTGNKSELAVGYCTLYGDMCGGLAVISDVFKTQVYALANWINDDARRSGRRPPIPQRSIDKPPSAELRPGQTDQDSLPPYDLLDAILQRIRGARAVPARSDRPGLCGDHGQRRGAQGRSQRIQTQTGGPRAEDHSPRLRCRPAHPDRAKICQLKDGCCLQ